MQPGPATFERGSRPLELVDGSSHPPDQQNRKTERDARAGEYGTLGRGDESEDSIERRASVAHLLVAHLDQPAQWRLPKQDGRGEEKAVKIRRPLDADTCSLGSCAVAIGSQSFGKDSPAAGFAW